MASAMLTLVALRLVIGNEAVKQGQFESNKLDVSEHTHIQSSSSLSKVDPMTQKAFADYADNVRGNAHSGLGSAPFPAFTEFLNSFLANKNPRSILEVSCGHWPSGWQIRGVKWPKADYLGVDITPGVVDDDLKMVQEMMVSGNQSGFNKMHFKVGDMVSDDLPRAEMLLTKDTLIHLPNAKISEFLKRNVLVDPPKYKYVMFVHDMEAAGKDFWGVENNVDVQLNGFHTLDLAAAPFSVPNLKNVFHYQANRAKVVQLLEFSNWHGEAKSSFDTWHTA